MNSEVSVKQLKAICEFCAKPGKRLELSRAWYVADKKKLYATDGYIAFCGDVDAGPEDFCINPDSLKRYVNSVKFDLCADLDFCERLDYYGISSASIDAVFSDAAKATKATKATKDRDKESVMFDPGRLNAVVRLAKSFNARVQMCGYAESMRPFMFLIRNDCFIECRVIVMPEYQGGRRA